MESFQELMDEYKNQLKKGAIQKAYQGLMQFIMDLRTYLAKKYPNHFVSGSIYCGTMDMTYFSFTPKSLQDRELKAAIVFIHDRFRFEIWLAAANKRVQSKFWKLLKDRHWNKYPIVPSTKGADSIVEHILIENPDFSNLDSLTERIEREALEFIKNVEIFLDKERI